VLFFKHKHLKKLMGEKFSVLDKIRNVRLADDANSMPITVSMGIAATKTSDGNFNLSDFERDAMAALEIAFQRGGDQVVVKTENGLEYFGGITKAAQKRTKNRARFIASQLCTLISNSSQVIVMGHKNPDFDSIGACIGVARLAMFCGVDCHIVSDFESINFETLTERIDFPEEYRSIFTDAVTAIDMITPDTLVVVADVNNMAIVEAPEIVSNAKSVFIIDHHRQTDELPGNVITPSYIEPAASSTCELIAEMLEDSLPNGDLLKEEALAILAGIMVDTNNFTRSTSTRTFGAALYLRSQGANTEYARTFFSEEFSEYLSEAKFGTDVSIYRHNIAITRSEGTGDVNDRVAAAKAADKLLSVRGIDASFALVKIGEGVNISGRSNGKVNVQLILEKFNGGGHFDVAGARIDETTLDEATERLKKAINDYFKERKR
ncbi:MAG: DHH family phosphoesterase, partial [Clostridia bacterium]|nr:DHH family phosphoesterase [Clostridia bacterium]